MFPINKPTAAVKTRFNFYVGYSAQIMDDTDGSEKVRQEFPGSEYFSPI